MIKKLFIYDFRVIAEKLIPLYIASLVVSIITRLLLIISKFDFNNFENEKGGFIIMISLFFLGFSFLIIIFGIFLMTNFLMTMRFHQSIYGNEGYLTNTLPLTSHQIILSKIFNFFIWSLIGGCIVIISLFLIIPYDFGKFEFAQISLFFSELLSTEHLPEMLLFFIISGFIQLFFNILRLYLSVAIGNLFSNYKLVMGIVGYILISIILSAVSIFILTIVSISFEGISYVSKSTNLQENPFFNSINIMSLILNIIFCFVIYYVIVYLHKNKLNLE